MLRSSSLQGVLSQPPSPGLSTSDSPQAHLRLTSDSPTHLRLTSTHLRLTSGNSARQHLSLTSPPRLPHLASSPSSSPHLISSSPLSSPPLRDDKGRTALDVARGRGHALAARLLQRATPSLRTRIVTMISGSDGSKGGGGRVLFCFYVLNSALCYTVYATILAPSVGTPLQHQAYLAMSVAMQVSYLKVHTAPPGVVESGPKGRHDYEAAMKAAAEQGSLAASSDMPALCHTCRIVKPLRSKHCTTLKKCVSMFDHYCPYIGNTIGGVNYAEFCVFIFCGLVNLGQSVAAAVQYLLIADVKAWYLLVWLHLLDYSMALLMAVGMNQYHLSLILRNLTTNEDMNKHRFAYLRNELNQFHNPFSTGACGNLREVCSRRRTVLENPYVYSERFRALASGDGDIERTEKDGDSERASMMRHTQDEH